MRQLRRLALPVLFLFCTSVGATRPEHRIFSTAEEFLKGEFKGVAVSNDGRLAAAPADRELYDTAEAFVYDMLPWQGGFLLATGNNGKIFRVDADGKGSLLVTLDEPAVYALAADGQGRVYAATSPDGKVYRISADGKAEKFFEPQDKYLWDLAVDESGNVFVATGPRGIIYRVTPSGDGRPFYDSEETHVVSLAWDLNRNLLAGSAPGGLLFRFDSSGKPFVLFDSSLEEVRSMTLDRYGVIYAVAVSGTGRPAAEKSASTSSSTTTESASAESTVAPAPTAKGARLHVHRIDKDNLAQTIYTSDDELAFDLSLRSDGTVLLATGDRGRVLALSPQGFLTLLADLPEEQVTRVVEQGGSLFAATSNLGKLFRLGGDATGPAIYESEVLDAGSTARWGNVRWRVVSPSAADSVRVFTRSGNTVRPDGTWSSWEGPYANPAGSPIRSQAARYLQWKLEFSASAREGSLVPTRDFVDQVAVSFQQANLPPRLVQLNVLAPGVALVKGPANQSGGLQPGGPDGAYLRSLPVAIRRLDGQAVNLPSRKVYMPGARSFTWKGQDPNEDDLIYTLHLRRDGDARWVLIAEDLVDEEYTLDGTSLADGTYQVRVVASDRVSNPPSQALEHELVSKPFVVSNRVPVVEWQPTEVEGTSARLRFVAKAPVSPLYQVEYSLDGRTWVVVLPEDGIVDSPEEQFVLSLTGLRSGRQSVSLRVVDLVGNVGAFSQSFDVQ